VDSMTVSERLEEKIFRHSASSSDNESTPEKKHVPPPILPSCGMYPQRPTLFAAADDW
jgi:hypothetical protein